MIGENNMKEKEETLKKQLEIYEKMTKEFEEVFDYDILPSKKNYLLQAIYMDFKKAIENVG